MGDTEDDVVSTTGVSLIIFNIKQIYDIFEEKNSFNCFQDEFILNYAWTVLRVVCMCVSIVNKEIKKIYIFRVDIDMTFNNVSATSW